MAKKYKKLRKGGPGRLIAAGVILGTVVLGVAFWGAPGPQGENVRVAASGDRIQRVPAGRLPAFAPSGDSLVQGGYRYAVAHPEVLRYIPCYCGCERFGHRYNGDCYIQDRHADGTITFTSHGAT